MHSDRKELESLVATMKRAAAALRDAEIPFMLGGGLAAWARGGPRTDHDVDFFVEEADAERAQQALVEAGMKPERPTEEWLLKAHDGDVLVDLIFKPSGDPIGPEYFQRANELEVMGQTVLVASIAGPVVLAQATAVGLVLSQRLVELRSVLDLLLRPVDDDLLGRLVHTADHPGGQHDLLAEDPRSGVDDDVARTCLVRRVVHLADRPVEGLDLVSADVDLGKVDSEVGLASIRPDIGLHSSCLLRCQGNPSGVGATPA